MKFFWKLLLVLAVVLGSLYLSGLSQSQTTRFYDQRGRYVGKAQPDYAGRCCAVYDQRGSRVGRIEQPRAPRSTQDNRGQRR
jgi:hypothetical protein